MHTSIITVPLRSSPLPSTQRIPLLRPEQMGKVVPPALRGLDCFPGTQVFIAGTAHWH